MLEPSPATTPSAATPSSSGTNFIKSFSATLLKAWSLYKWQRHIFPVENDVAFWKSCHLKNHWWNWSQVLPEAVATASWLNFKRNDLFCCQKQSSQQFYLQLLFTCISVYLCRQWTKSKIRILIHKLLTTSRRKSLESGEVGFLQWFLTFPTYCANSTLSWRWIWTTNLLFIQFVCIFVILYLC